MISNLFRSYVNFWQDSDGEYLITRGQYWFINLIHSFILTLVTTNGMFSKMIGYSTLQISISEFIFMWIIEFLILGVYVPLVWGAILSFLAVTLIFGGLGLIGIMTTSFNNIFVIIAPLILSIAWVGLQVYVVYKHLQFYNNRARSIKGGKPSMWLPIVKAGIIVGAIFPIIFVTIVGTSIFTSLTGLQGLMSLQMTPTLWIVLMILGVVLLFMLPTSLSNLFSPKSSTRIRNNY